MRPLAACLALSLLASTAHAQLIPEDAEPEKVTDGYRFTEGPAAGPGGCIYFTDIPAELILRYDPETGETETVVENSGQANGLMFRDTWMFMCTHRSRMLGVFIIPPRHQQQQGNFSLLQDGEIHALTSEFEGKHLNSPNDLAIDSEGHIYFTDPRYGNRDSMEIDVEGVYFVAWDRRAINDAELFDEDPELEPTRIIDDLTRPNGIALSPDESILYVADNGTNEVFAYDVTAPGEIENKRLFAQLNGGEGGGPDGMCVDLQGRVYAAGQGKVWVYNPDGSAAGVISVGPQCTNCTFGADGKTLYITANRGLYRIELNTDEALPEAEEENAG